MRPKWAAVLKSKLALHEISQNELADKLGCSFQWVSSVLNGKRTAKDSRERFSLAVDEIIEERREQ